MSTLLRYAVTLSWNVLAVPLVLLIHLMWGEHLHREGLAVCTELRPDSWPKRTWYAKWGGTTFGHAIMYGPNPPLATRVHENVHVHQFEASMLKSLTVGLLVLLVTGKIWLSFAIWVSGYLLYLCSNWAMAVIRGGEAYRDSVHEQHAYSVGELWDEKHSEEYQHRGSKA